MKTKSLKKLLLISIVSILTLVFSSTLLHAQGKVPEKEKFGGTLRIAVKEDFRSLDARYLPVSGSATLGQQHLYNRLVDYGPKGTHDTISAIATDWKRIDDVTWLVYLRKGVKFHNGKEMTAEDVAKNYDWRLRSNEYTKGKGWRPPLGKSTSEQIKNVEPVDKYTLKFTLKFPFTAFVEMNLGWGTQGIIDPDVVEKYGKQATLHPVGTGPFKFVEYVSGSHLILERFNDYWGGKAYLDRIIFRILPDAQIRFIVLQKGEVDIATDLSLSQVSEIKKDPNLKYNQIVEVHGIYGCNKKVHDFPAHSSGHILICTSWNNMWLEKK